MHESPIVFAQRGHSTLVHVCVFCIANAFHCKDGQQAPCYPTTANAAAGSSSGGSAPAAGGSSNGAQNTSRPSQARRRSQDNEGMPVWLLQDAPFPDMWLKKCGYCVTRRVRLWVFLQQTDRLHGGGVQCTTQACHPARPASCSPPEYVADQLMSVPRW